MRLDAFLLADAASIEGGKLFLMGGGITRIEAPFIPWQLPTLAVFAQFSAEPAELEREHQMQFRITAPDGTDMIPAASFSVPSDAKVVRAEGEESFARMVLGVGPLIFPQAGIYRVNLVVDGEKVRDMALPVRVHGQGGS